MPLCFTIALASALPLHAWAQSASGSQAVETVVVVANTPLPGTGIDANKIAGEVDTFFVPDLTKDRRQDVLPNLVATQLSSVSLNDEQGSQFQPDLVYRGFEASPISGIAEGIAVYQDGVRLNEAFGDTVNWDLVPEFAIDNFTLQSNNPVFGLNAIGGAVSLEMKNGLDFQGTEVELSGGSFGNVTGDAQYGGRFGDFGIYLGIGGEHDDGFRYQSPAALRQAYGDVAYERGALALHLSASGADDDIGAVGPTPVQMLAQDPKAVFTYPQSMRNEMELVQLRGTYRASDVLSVSFDGYYRHFLQNLIDGNTTDVDYCVNNPAELCLEGNDDYPGDALYDAQGNPVPASVLPPGATPGETDHSRTDTNTLGAALQASLSAPVLGHANNFVAGASIDRGTTDYRAYGELGTLLDSLAVTGVGVIIDQSQNPTAQPPLEEPVDVNADNTYLGAYAMDVLDVTSALSWTVSARLNIGRISLQDLLGRSLNGDHSFTHLNPGTGLTYKFSHALTVYAGYSQSNRAPTPGELSCADPASPCLMDAFLVADPALRQVVSQDYEAGFRGAFVLEGVPGNFAWKIGAYRTDAARDILLLGTQVNGFGYFRNAGTTRRQGVDFHFEYRDESWRLSASYSRLDATFRNAEVLSSNSPAADANGFIYVQPGDRMPMDPANRVTLSASYDLTPSFGVGADLRYQSGQYLVGDESDQEPKLPGFATIDLRGDYRLTDRVELFGEVENLLDRRSYTYGTFTQLDGLPPDFALTDPRTYSPSPPRIVTAGLRAQFD